MDMLWGPEWATDAACRDLKGGENSRSFLPRKRPHRRHPCLSTCHYGRARRRRESALAEDSHCLSLISSSDRRRGGSTGRSPPTPVALRSQYRPRGGDGTKPPAVGALPSRRTAEHLRRRPARKTEEATHLVRFSSVISTMTSTHSLHIATLFWTLSHRSDLVWLLPQSCMSPRPSRRLPSRLPVWWRGRPPGYAAFQAAVPSLAEDHASGGPLAASWNPAPGAQRK